MFFRQPGLGIEGVNLGNTSGHVTKDDVLYLRCEVGSLRGQGAVGGVRRCRIGIVVRQHAGQGGHGETERAALQYFAAAHAARPRLVGVVRGAVHGRSH